jgi:predicted phosphate transport protein (TIGR00153 family)
MRRAAPAQEQPDTFGARSTAMALDAQLSIFKPRDRVFFYHFEASAANVLKMSEDLIAIMNTEPGAQRTALLERMEIAERANDDLTHTIFTDLARNFITPIDREDIHSLATSLDDVADFILASAKNLELFGIGRPDATCQELARLVNEGCRIVQLAVQNLRHMHKSSAHMEFVVQINSMENQADEVFDRAIQQLFATEKDPIELIRKRDVYAVLELATDKCEDVSNVMESIMLKYA